MPPENSTIGVQMGRFCPFTRGHALMTDIMVRDYGADRSLIIIGSQNALRLPDIPFTFEERREIIRRSLQGGPGQDIEIIGMDDSNPDDPKKWDLPKWWKMLHTLETERAKTFEFYGGSEDDLRYHKQGGFRTKVAVDRSTDGPGRGINATAVRTLMQTILTAQNDGQEDGQLLEQLGENVHPDAVEIALEYFQKNLRTLLKA